MLNICKNCGSNQIRVTDSREKRDHIYRRRDCIKCKAKFSTREISEQEYKRIKKIEADFIEQVRNFTKKLDADAQQRFFDKIIS